MKPLEFIAKHTDDTDVLAGALSATLPSGTVVGLVGPLGAGKTRLVQGVAAAEGVAPGTVTSPTFVLCHEYQGRRPIYHLDVYRVADEDEFFSLGPQEYFEGEGITFVEWADRVAGCLPNDRLDVTIDVVDETARRFHIAAQGERSESVLEELRRRLDAD